MHCRSDQESVPMKSGDLLGGYSCRKETSRQEVYRIPDTMLASDSVTDRQDRHGHAARQPTFDSCGNWINFEGQPRAVKFVGDPSNASHFRASRDYRLNFAGNRHSLVRFVRENVAKPADGASQTEHRAENA